MIKTISANDNSDLFINHRKIEVIKEFNNNSHIILETGKTLIVKNSIDDIINQIIKFESSVSINIDRNSSF